MNPRAYRRPTRIVERKIQPALLVTPADDIMNPTSIIATEPNSLPDLYEIAVQVKFWFFWIDVWATPQDLFDELNREFDFNLDPCALPDNAKCEKYFTPAVNGLIQCWGVYSFL